MNILKKNLFLKASIYKETEKKATLYRDWETKKETKKTEKKVSITAKELKEYKQFKLNSMSAEERGKSLKEEPNEIAARAIKLFGKRWIKKYNGSIKHWLITELGHGKRAEHHKSTERLHLHGFLWTTKSASEIEETWTYGWVDTGEYVNDKSVGLS